MENSSAVSVQNVSKKFRLFGSPKERFWEALHPFNKKYHREFWALKDISFEVAKGMTLGIIGRNGSGKSTLLQIICSVLRPTSGEVRVNGRISALLELGAGFNPQFTGRDNVILNGALMGFTRREMEERLPSIEKFADIGEFFDQPVKTYSSGMFVRLAFAGAINVDPDILIVDEALAVGDAKFQHKCYNKFLEFQKKGKTILFVSHSTDAIVRHCDYAVLLENGKVLESGEPKTVMNCYLDLLFTGKLHEYAPTPVLIEEGYKGFNIIHFGKKYYAFSQSLGRIDISSVVEQKMSEWLMDNKCFIGSSINEVKQLVNKSVLPDGSPSVLSLEESKPEKKDTEIESFLNEIPDTDNCVNRRSYNKNEYRYGDRRAEIIDYLIVAGKEYDPTTIVSGEVINIYVKIKYYQEIEDPMTGFAIKTIDGIDVYGISTKGMKVELQSIDAPLTVAVFKWSIVLKLARGDYFIDIGCGEYVNGESLPLDRRYSIAHIVVYSDDIYAGFVELETRFERVC